MECAHLRCVSRGDKTNRARAQNIHLGQGRKDVSVVSGKNHIADQSQRSISLRLMSPLEHMRLPENEKME